MNLDFTKGVRLRFGTGLDSGQWMDDGSWIGAQRVGPRGPLVELERSLGLPSVELSATDRVSRFEELLGGTGSDGEAFWNASLAVDRYAVAADLLPIRDELVLAGWDFSVDNRAPRRLRDLNVVYNGGVEGVVVSADAEADVLETLVGRVWNRGCVQHAHLVPEARLEL